MRDLQPDNGTISAPSYTTYNADGTTATVNDVGSAIDNLNNQGVKYSHTNSTLPTARRSVPTRRDRPERGREQCG
ncbi:hypothetical protein WK57_19240 [Burkholderia ubonensis]|uniref:Uncharacterized protein n=1 Tax=Burkholderia ubonensis TaxID=101571 RepID=A0AA40R8Z3_9BURK|nr:hypothetical protein [Burkholderia ubonensis]KWZ58568.1 hypothetical protein WK57_19240 [Burkholderia ubonensis]